MQTYLQRSGQERDRLAGQQQTDGKVESAAKRQTDCRQDSNRQTDGEVGRAADGQVGSTENRRTGELYSKQGDW